MPFKRPRHASPASRVFTRLTLAGLALLAGCDESPEDPGTDGGPPAAADAAPDPVVPGEVTLTVTLGGAPVASVLVYFQNADSSLVAAVTTDADGVARAVMAPGGFVTAIDPWPDAFPTWHDVLTFAGVKPDDHLGFDAPARYPGAFAATVVGPVDPGASDRMYVSRTSCDSNTVVEHPESDPSLGIKLLNACDVADVLFYTKGNGAQPPSTLEGYIWAPDQAVSAGAVIDLSARSYLPPVSRTYTYTNAVTPVQVSHEVLSPRGTVYATRDEGSGDPAVMQLEIPEFAGARHRVKASYRPDVNDAAIHHFIDWDGASDPVIDLASRALPTITTRPVVAADGHTITWTESGGGAQPDYVVIGVGSDASLLRPVWKWQIVGPRQGTTLVLPVLPTGVADFNLKSSDYVSVTTVKALGGYDAARAKALQPRMGVEGDGEGAFASMSLSQRWDLVAAVDHLPAVYSP